MSMKKIFLFIFTLVLIAIFPFSGCSREEKAATSGQDIEKMFKEKMFKDRKQKTSEEWQEPMSLQQQDEKQRKKGVASAEACQKEFERCVENCKDERCEDSCLEFLAACEKELPTELQTLKKH